VQVVDGGLALASVEEPFRHARPETLISDLAERVLEFCGVFQQFHVLCL
jgi:hypothetical protein